MTLKPGYARYDATEKKYLLDEQALSESTALLNSMAKEMEDAMEEILKDVKNQSIPDGGKEGFRLLFIAISRGVLKYLEAHQEDLLKRITIEYSGGFKEDYAIAGADLNIDLSKPP